MCHLNDGDICVLRILPCREVQSSLKAAKDLHLKKENFTVRIKTHYHMRLDKTISKKCQKKLKRSFLYLLKESFSSGMKTYLYLQYKIL